MIDALARWAARAPVPAFCRERLAEAARLLPEKLAREVGDRPHRPLGRVLLVIAEHDVIGTVAGVVGALVTGNRVRCKARTTRPLLESLSRALDADCEILDWDSRTQDDAAVLAGVDGVVLAGGDELIRHYRRVTPPGVRLIEFGPKLSCAVIGAGADLARTADALVHDVTLFDQGVCSSPQWILADDDAIVAHLRDRLATCPVLDDESRLLQYARSEALRLRGKLAAFDPVTGWGITVGSLDDRLPRGFAVVLGVEAQLAELARRYPQMLQVIGVAGDVPPAPRFTHRCPIGRMHQRSPLAPHDGVFELAQLVVFTSEDA